MVCLFLFWETDVKRIFSGGEFEAKLGYCRAVVAGGFVHVAGTCGQGDDVTAQCRGCPVDYRKRTDRGREQYGAGRAGDLYAA